MDINGAANHVGSDMIHSSVKMSYNWDSGWVNIDLNDFLVASLKLLISPNVTSQNGYSLFLLTIECSVKYLQRFFSDSIGFKVLYNTLLTQQILIGLVEMETTQPGVGGGLRWKRAGGEGETNRD